VVAVVDPVDIFRVGLVHLFQEAGYTAEASGTVPECWPGSRAPDLIIVVVRAREQIRTVAAARSRTPAIAVLALIDDIRQCHYLELIGAGASAVLPASSESAQVLASAAAAICGSFVIPATVARDLVTEHTPTSSLSQRDLAWLTGLAHGRTISSLAKQGGYSERSLHRLLADTYRRLGARNRSEAIAEASRRGLLSA
jgi:DNA-binding NarL/FixJ family response regulator